MKNGWQVESNCGPALNRLAREQMKVKLLADIRNDLAVCELEGTDPREFINELIEMLKQLGKNHEQDF